MNSINSPAADNQTQVDRDLDPATLRKLVKDTGLSHAKIAEVIAFGRQVADSAIPSDILERDAKKKRS